MDSTSPPSGTSRLSAASLKSVTHRLSGWACSSQASLTRHPKGPRPMVNFVGLRYGRMHRHRGMPPQSPRGYPALRAPIKQADGEGQCRSHQTAR